MYEKVLEVENYWTVPPLWNEGAGKCLKQEYI